MVMLAVGVHIFNGFGKKTSKVSGIFQQGYDDVMLFRLFIRKSRAMMM